MVREKKSEDLGVKFGSDDMVFWRNIIDARKMDLETAKGNLKYTEATLEMAQAKYAEAEKEFNK